MTTPSSDEPGGPREEGAPQGPQSPAPGGPPDQGPQSPYPGPPPPPPPGPETPAYPPPPGPQGWQPPGQPAMGYAQPYGGSPPNAPGAVPALVLGILGLVVCAICAPFAWSQGQKAERLIAAEPGRYGGKGMASAGKILGIIGTVLLGLGIVALVILLIVGAASST
jgi:hypothetical protein